MNNRNCNRRQFLRITASGAFGLAAGSLFGSKPVIAQSQNRPPNFVIIFTDDQGYRDLGCYGSPNINTPNLDKMADEGMRFIDFYAASSVCSPSRAALLTGCYPPRVGITKVLFPNDTIGLNPDEITIADVLKQQGYATGCIGKWHLGHLPKFLPTNNGFDYYFGIPYSNDMDPQRDKNRNLDRAWTEKDYSPWNVPFMRNEQIIERPAVQTTLTERYTQEAVSFIRKNKDRPFFLYLPHSMPHIPLFVSDEFYTDDPRKSYKAAIEEIDSSVGRVLAALKDEGVDDNTLVIFTSDNGPWLEKKHHGGSALPLRDGKMTTYEGGMREPCIMRWPGKIPAGCICGELCATIDLLPTIAALAGGKVPAGRVIDGKDITAIIKAAPGAKSPHQEYFYYKDNTLEAVRSGKWKLLRKQQSELYDLQTDIGEKNNLAAEHPDIVQHLTKTMKEFDKQLKSNSRPAGSAD